MKERLACGYGVHDFVQKPLPVDVFAREHFHECLRCGALYIRDCSPCALPVAEGEAC